MDKIAVLMSTYNGQKYLREQIDSILNQVDVYFELFIRDDGSTDDTVKIITEYVDKYSNIHFERGENLGVGNSFMNLLYSAPASFDYYSFADQDDIWLPNKLNEGVKLLKESGKYLYVSNQENVDKDGNSLGLRWEINDKRVFLTPEGIISSNVLCGCTMIMTGNFAKLICEENRRPSDAVLKSKNHDGWIAVVAAVYNGLIYDDRAFIKYRQHGDNVVGSYKQSLRQRINQRRKKLFNKDLRCIRSRESREICEKFAEVASEFFLLQICAKTETHNDRKDIIKHSAELRKFTGEGKFSFKLKVWLGFF
ncbi:MAG: glycosyltransferase family 2 protein [Roseburia sp.]|nr:glycosyltransferase family 2 protein [Roseburia sp.]